MVIKIAAAAAAVVIFAGGALIGLAFLGLSKIAAHDEDEDTPEPVTWQHWMQEARNRR